MISTKPAESSLVVRPVAGRIGAEILGVQLSGSLQPATVEAIREALLRHKVIFFRDQTTRRRRAGARSPSARHPRPASDRARRGRHQRRPELDGTGGGGANSWHTDVTFVDAYPKISILRGVVIPAVGGDTSGPTPSRPTRSLPAALKALADKLWAVHTQRLRLCPRDRGNAEEERPQALRRGLHLDALRDRAPGRARAPGDRRALAGAGPLRAALRRSSPRRSRGACYACSGPRHEAREHRALALAGRATSRSGTTAPPSTARRRLRRPAARGAARHHRRRGRSASTAAAASRARRPRPR